MPILRLCLIFAPLLLSACASVTYYPNSASKNVRVLTELKDPGMFEEINAAIEVYRGTPQCDLIYKGLLPLEGPETKLGLSTKSPSYLNVLFQRGGFLNSRSSSIGYETWLKTRPGYRYEMRLRYVDSIYSVNIFEINTRTQRKREIEQDNGRCPSR